MKHLTLFLVFVFICEFSNAQIAPDFTIIDSDSVSHNLYSDYLDSGKIVVIKMFFIDCPICKPFNTPFQAMYEEFGSGEQDVEFLLLTTKTWDTNVEIADYKTQYGLTFPGSGLDGGGYDATAPYRNGDFGTFFGAPTFLVIEPNKTVHFDLAASGVTATMKKVKDKIIEIQDEGSGSVPMEINIDIQDYKGGNLPSFALKLRSGLNPDSSYLVPQNFFYPTPDYPALSAPEIIVEINEMTTSGITTIDLVLIQRYILNIIVFDNIQRLAADVNGSGTLTPSDLLSMRKVILSIQDGFAVGKSYLAVDGRCNDSLSNCTESIQIDTSLTTQELSFRVIKYGDMK